MPVSVAKKNTVVTLAAQVITTAVNNKWLTLDDNLQQLVDRLASYEGLKTTVGELPADAEAILQWGRNLLTFDESGDMTLAEALRQLSVLSMPIK